MLKVSQTLNEDSSSIEQENDHQLDRRSSQRVAQMLRQMLQRGEMQVHPHRIHAFLHRLYSRTSKD